MRCSGGKKGDVHFGLLETVRGLTAAKLPRTYAWDSVEHLLRVDTVNQDSVGRIRRTFAAATHTPRYDLDQSD